MSPAYSPGQLIPGTQYAFTRVLGAGGHGTVYAVEHTFLQAPSVMKLLHAELANEGNLALRMTREARTLAKLRHPNIVEVRDGGITTEDPPRPFFVMEPLNGMSLRQLRKNMGGRSIGVLAALRIVIGVLEGLHHAHSAGVIHRDIKPDNIFLHRTSTDLTVPKVLDFGIAHLLMGQQVTGQHFLGTPRYAAPEQMRGEPVGPTTDIYSTGLVLHELITGAPPFADKKELGPLLLAHLNDRLPKISELVPDAPPGIDDFLAYLLEKDPARRPPTAFAAAVAAREIRSYIEARQDGSVHATDFKTEPSPMDNFLIEASPGDPAFVTEPAARALPPTRRAAQIQRTVPMAGRPGHDDEPARSRPGAPIAYADT
ncbi:MAG: serine/threonine protein kinase, partial [Labilithrix sp.]|nr:serine/threonine protein kinase [Labilithrix sp.]